MCILSISRRQALDERMDALLREESIRLESLNQREQTSLEKQRNLASLEHELTTGKADFEAKYVILVF